MRVSYAGAAAHPSADAAGRRGRGGRGRGSKGGAGGGNATQHCFTIAPAAAAAGNQSACATPQCCGAGLKLVKAFVVISERRLLNGCDGKRAWSNATGPALARVQ